MSNDPGSTTSKAATLATQDAPAGLYRDLFDAIQTGQLRPGQRLASMTELAKQYGLTFTTVRATLGRLEAAGLVQRRRGSGTYVTFSDHHNASASQSVAVMLRLRSRDHIYNRLANDVLEGLPDLALTAAPFLLREEEATADLQRLLTEWQAHPPRAIVLHWWAERGVGAQLQPLIERGTSLITSYLNPKELPPYVHWVGVDYEELGRRATEHLMALGHRRVGVVMRPRTASAGTPVRRKVELSDTAVALAVGRTLRGDGLRRAMSLCYQGAVGDRKDLPHALHEANIQRVMQWLDRADRPTAVLGNDVRVFAVKRAAERLGLRVPEDLAIIGFGNTPWAEAADLASFDLRPDLAATNILRLLERDPTELKSTVHRVHIRPELVLRESCPEA